MRKPLPPILLLTGLLASAGSWGQDAQLPLTIDERIAACVDAEDNDPARAIALAESVLAESPAPTVVQRAEALGCRGWSQAALAHRDEARRDAHDLRSLLSSLRKNADRVRLTRRVGGILHRSGDRVGAIDLYAEAVADAERQGLEAERIPLLVNLGVLHSEFEEHERARVNYEQALALMDRLQDFRHEAPVRYNLGLNLTGQDRHAEAVPHFRRALVLIEDSGAGSPAQEIAVKLALSGALLETGDVSGSEQLIDTIRRPDQSLYDSSTRLQLTLIEAGQQAAAGNPSAALAMLDGIDGGSLPEIQRWNLLGRRASLLERLGRYREATTVLREINQLRETYLRHQNHERLAALDAHMRDREQRMELERLKADAEAQTRRLQGNARLQWIAGGVAVLLLLLGGAVLIWQRRMNRMLFEASHTDPLTGLANRRAMVLRLNALSRQSGGIGAVMLIDIDLFKRINDQCGHDAGDEVLRGFGRRLLELGGDPANVARWGGEEFLLVLPGSDRDATTTKADQLRQKLAQPIQARDRQIAARVSIGIATMPLPGASGPDAWHYSLQLADSALYLAKRSGRDAWVCYWLDEVLPDWPPERLAREAHLARSLGAIVPIASRPLREPLIGAIA